MSLLEQNIRYIGIIGSRRRDTTTDYEKTLTGFQSLVKEFSDWTDGGPEIVIISGGCPHGGDRFAEKIADRYHYRKIIHPPDRNTFLSTPMPYRATKQNYARNTLIAADSKDDLIACVAEDRTGGTEDTIKKYRSIHKKEPILV